MTDDDVFATVSVLIDESKIPFYKLFGSMDAKDVVITMGDRFRLRLAKQQSQSQSAMWKRLEWDFQSRTFLFVGYGLGDQDVLEVVFSVHRQKHRPPQSYAVIERPMPLTARELGKYGIRIIHENTDQFFKDLIKTYRQLKYQVSQTSATTPLKHRYLSIWESFVQIVNDRNFSGLCLYGQSKRSKDRPMIEGELNVIPTEMYEECKRLQENGERILCVSLGIAQLGTEVYIEPWRFVRWLEDVVHQLDTERSCVGLPPLDLLERLERTSEELWEKEADARVYRRWYREFGEDRYADVRDAVDNPTREQQKENRRIRERYLTGQASDWFSWELDSALAGHRLVVFITDFQLIEADKKWFQRVSQFFLNKLREHNVGLIITRRASKPLSVDRTFAAYSLDRIIQFDLARYVQGG